MSHLKYRETSRRNSMIHVVKGRDALTVKMFISCVTSMLADGLLCSVSPDLWNQEDRSDYENLVIWKC